MARSFASASSDYAENGAAVITGYPCTLFGWFQVTDRTVGQALMAVGAGGGTTRVQLSNNNSGIGACTSVTAAGGTQSSVTASNSISNDTWFALGGVFAGTSSRTCYFNGTAQTLNNIGVSLGTLDRTTIGARYSGGSRGAYLNGLAAECAVWNVALSAADMAALAAGVCPLLIRPGALVFYAPLFGAASPEVELMGRAELTLGGTAAAAHTAIYRPKPARVIVPASAAAAAPSRRDLLLLGCGA